jgi:hypothetical protein
VLISFPTPGDLLLLLFLLQVLEEVRVLLQPNAGGVVAELDKLNVYGPGGFFKPHFDTRRSEGKPLWAHATVCWQKVAATLLLAKRTGMIQQ